MEFCGPTLSSSLLRDLFVLLVASVLHWSSAGEIDKGGEGEWTKNYVLTSGKGDHNST